MTAKTVLLWSGGKDSCLALVALRQRGNVDVAGLLTTCTELDDRVSMHSVPRRLIEQQATSVNLPLHVVHVPANPTNAGYETRMSEKLVALREQGINTIAAGDIFLQDLRDYREARWAKLGMSALFPLWLKDTRSLAREFIDIGFKAITICVDTTMLDSSFAGQLITPEFLARLPEGVDLCGENGEYHSFVFDGPTFREPISVEVGKIVTRGRFCSCELGATS